MNETTAIASKLVSYWKRPLFAAGGHTYHAIDAALLAMLRSEWSRFEREVAEGLAAQTFGDREGTLPRRPALDAAADTFRYDRDLIAADEINAWLDRTGVSSDEWYGYLGRALMRERHRPQLDDLLDRFPPSSRDVLTSAFVDGVCSRAFDRFERTAAGRAALAVESGPTESTSVHRNLAERVAHTHTPWLTSWEAPDVLSRLERLAAIEAACSKAVATVATPERMADVVELHKLDWRRVETVTLTFATEHAAREAMLCVKADGLSVYDVAAISRRQAMRQERFFADLNEEVRDRILAQEVGVLGGPYAVGRSFELSMVLGHHLPVLTDASVAARAQQALIDAAIERATSEHVQWSEVR